MGAIESSTSTPRLLGTSGRPALTMSKPSTSFSASSMSIAHDVWCSAAMLDRGRDHFLAMRAPPGGGTKLDWLSHGMRHPGAPGASVTSKS
jgi:hypothetical protein